jgi:DNA-binding transcriptional ArsR family regulator
LRDVALKNQQEQPRAFHAVREVAAHFRVPVSTVSRTYRVLEQEGLITRVRGSKTLLQGLHFDRRLGVRAFVGLPASLSDFITIHAYRMFFIRIRRELRLRGFATAMVFSEGAEAKTAALSERLKTYEIDTVLWFQPPREAKETAARLADLGIRLIGIAHEQTPVIQCRYQVRRDSAIKALLTQWKGSAGVNRVTLVRTPDLGMSALEETLHRLLDDLGIKSTVAVFEGKRSEPFLRSLQKLKTDGIIFASAHLVSKLCFRAPSAVSDLVGGQRVAFLNGPVSMPFARVPNVRADLTVVDWQLVAERIVNDLITQDAFTRSGPTIFEADARLRVPLSDFAQSI